MRKNSPKTERLAGARRGLADERGTALIIAITLLFLFVLLGTAYVKFGYLEIEETNYTLSQARARALAEAGVNAAIGKIHAALLEEKAITVLGTATYTFPIYRGAMNAEAPVLEPLDNRTATADVTVSDESGKINLNHAPASVLQRMLNVDGNTARAITASLPQADASGAVPAGSRWFTSISDLLDRKLLTPEQFAALDKSLVTVYTVLDHQQAGSYLSINTAPVPVLAAVLDLPTEQAEHVKARGPFNSLGALAEAAGKGIDTFNIQPDPAAVAAGSPAPFLMQPNCFRITSNASYDAMSNKHSVSAYVEAIVLFDSQANYQIVQWATTEGTTELAAPAETVAPGETAAPAAEAPAPAEGAEAPAAGAEEAAPEQAPKEPAETDTPTA